MKFLQQNSLANILSILEGFGHETKTVGGCVRDSLLGITPKDIDIATQATPEQVLSIFRSKGFDTAETGLQHGTVTVVSNRVPYEITTLRTDTETDGRHAVVSFTRDFKTDAERRDLTINAMYVGLDGKIVDYFDGRSHLKNGEIQFVGQPSKRIQEDYLRILRFFRFRARISDIRSASFTNNISDIDNTTLMALSDNKDGLKKISRERIWAEISKSLTYRSFRPEFMTMRELGITDVIFPKSLSVSDAKLERMDDMLSNGCGPTSMIALFLNDFEAARSVASWFKMSNQEEYLMQKVAIALDDPEKISVREMCRSVSLEHASRKVALRSALAESARAILGSDAANAILEFEDKPMPINGSDLQEAGITAGPNMRTAMETAKNTWFDSGFQADREDLLEAALYSTRHASTRTI